MDGERIVEGSDVYMECLVQAKPKPYKVFSSGGLYGLVQVKPTPYCTRYADL